MNKRLFFVLLCTFFGFYCFSQSSEKVSEVLDCEEISKGQAAYFVSVYKGLSDDNVSVPQAFNALWEMRYFSGNEDPDEKISLAETCSLIAKATNMKGGIFYSIFHSGRYAMREFKTMGILPQYADPDQKVSGSEFLALLNEFENKENQND